MKATGIVRRMDPLGRIVLPMELRNTMNIKDGDPIEIFTEEDRIILRKYAPVNSCVLCGETKSDGDYERHSNGRIICHDCLAEYA